MPKKLQRCIQKVRKNTYNKVAEAMNKVQKVEYIKGIEEYLEKNHVYE